MISILIPTFNYSCVKLVNTLYKQCKSNGISFEIIVADDCSNLFIKENRQITNIEFCQFIELKQNIGRCKIRNYLGAKAIFNWLLFLDADTIPLKDNFISTYIDHIKTSTTSEIVINGGIVYQKEKPDQKELLRWVYGKKREALSVEKRRQDPYLSALSLNFLISKQTFNKVQFNENLPNLRKDDTVFSFDLMKHKIPIQHIDNPIVHLGLETSEVFLKKTDQATIVTKHLIDKGYLNKDYVLLSKIYYKIKPFGLAFAAQLFYVLFKSLLIRNFKSNNPNLFLFDLYRLGHYAYFIKKHHTL